MANYKNRDWILFIVLIIIFVLPFLYVTKFTFPAADDFCRTALDFDQYFNQFGHWYSKMTGRYTNFLFSYLPLYRLEVYRVVLAILFCLLGFSIFYFIKILWGYFEIKKANSVIAVVSVFVFSTLISQLPSLYEFFYWYAATTVYLISIIFFLLFLVMILKVLDGKPFHFLLFYGLIFLMNGNNEMLIPISNFVLLVVLARNALVQRVSHLYLLGANFVGAVSALIVVMAPGSANRQMFYPEGGQVFYSLQSAVLSAGMFSIKSIFELPYLFFYLGLFCLIFKLTRRKPIKSSRALSPVRLMLFSFLAVVSVFVVPYYATGGLDVNSGRIGNMIHAVFLLIMCINIINLAVFLEENTNFRYSVPLKRSSILLLSSYLILVLIMSRNYVNVRRDLIDGKFLQFRNAMMARLNYLEETDDSLGVISNIKGTKILPQWEISSDEVHWTNICYREYLANVYGVNLKKIMVKQDLNE